MSATIAVSISAMIAMPAANLPLMTSSRWMGCERSRDSVPWARSELTASNPKAMPTRGTNIATNATVGMPPAVCAPAENSSRKMAGVPDACDAASLMACAVKYSGTAAAMPMISSRT